MNFSYNSVRNIGYDPLLFNDKALSHIQLNYIEILHRQCRVLIIEVDHLESLFLLIFAMKNLRTLHVYYKYDQRNNQYDLLHIIQSSLPSKWTVTRFYYGCFIIRS